eukprot:2749748-Amphidinium_carterae.1
MSLRGKQSDMPTIDAVVTEMGYCNQGKYRGFDLLEVPHASAGPLGLLHISACSRNKNERITRSAKKNYEQRSFQK